MGYYGAHLRTLIWELSFAKMLFSIFFLENASQIGFRIPEVTVTAPRTYQRQRSQNPASDNERPSKPGVQGQSPGPLSPHFSGEWGPPAGQAGPPGPRPKGWLRSHPPKGYAAPCRPWQVVPLEPPQVSTCKGGFPPGPGRGSRLSRESPDARESGEGPRPPFLWPACAARSFWGRVPHCSGRWAITVPIYVP